VGTGGTTGEHYVALGVHRVGEIAGTGTDLINYTTTFGGECAANGTINVSSLRTWACTITNTRKPEPPQQTQCESRCTSLKQSCQATAGLPGHLTAAQCMAMYNSCIGQCP
jgi:hypothetical protein